MGVCWVVGLSFGGPFDCLRLAWLVVLFAFCVCGCLIVFDFIVVLI